MSVWAARAHSFFIRNNAKLWTNIAYVVATWVVIHQELRQPSGIGLDLFLAWLAVVTGSEITKRILAAKYNGTAEEPPPGRLG